MMIDEILKTKIDAAEPFSRERLEELKVSLPCDVDVLIDAANRIVSEYSFLVEGSIVAGLSGDLDTSILHHKLSFQCIQIIGMLMEQARGEKCNEYYLNPRVK